MLARNMSEEHMTPQAIRDDFIEYEIDGETFIVPEDVRDLIIEDATVTAEFQNRWFTRLSAAGFLDATEWSGPYRTEEGALWELYNLHGDDEEQTFLNFIGEGHKFVLGSLELRGHRNELYGKVVGETTFDQPRVQHIATLGDIDYNESTDEQIDYDPNEDHEIGEVYNFELVDGDELVELVQRVRNAVHDSEYLQVVVMYAGWARGGMDNPNIWEYFYLNVPAEISDEEAEESALASLREHLSIERRGNTAFEGVQRIIDEGYVWTYKADKEGIVQ